MPKILVDLGKSGGGTANVKTIFGTDITGTGNVETLGSLSDNQKVSLGKIDFLGVSVTGLMLQDFEKYPFVFTAIANTNLGQYEDDRVGFVGFASVEDVDGGSFIPYGLIFDREDKDGSLVWGTNEFHFPTVTEPGSETLYLAVTTDASGIAVEANPSGSATEALSKVRIEDKVYSVGGGGGTEVVANPGSATEKLETIGIGGTNYIVSPKVYKLTTENVILTLLSSNKRINLNSQDADAIMSGEYDEILLDESVSLGSSPVSVNITFHRSFHAESGTDTEKFNAKTYISNVISDTTANEFSLYLPQVIIYAMGDGSTNYCFMYGNLLGINIGTESSANGENSVAIGKKSTAAGESSIAIGTSSTASNGINIALGFRASASSGSSIALGPNATASGNYSTALGYFAAAPIRNSISFDSTNPSSFPDRILILRDPSHLFFRNADNSDSIAEYSGYAGGKTLQDYLDEKASIPELPSDANNSTYVLKAINGVLQWIKE